MQEKSEIKKAFLSVREACIFMGIKEGYIYQLIHKKKIPYYKPSGGRVFFRQGELEEFLSRNRHAADYEGEAV